MRVDQLYEKGVGKINEDAVVIGTTRFGVFDGVSSRNGYIDERGQTGGYIAAHIAKETFEESGHSLVETAMLANQRIEDAMQGRGIDIAKKENRWGTTMAVIDIQTSEKTFDWAQIADSLILVIYRDETFKQLIEGDYDHDRRIMMLWKKLADEHAEGIRDKLDSDIRQLRQTVNINFGVLNGESVAPTFIRTGRESLDNVAHILIFTDGLLVPKEDPEATDDFSQTVKLFLEGGLAHMHDYVRSIEETDPNCWKYPRYKKSDDIAAVALSL